jgi:hypothetical protein
VFRKECAVSEYSTKQAWLEGEGDLREADVDDVPVRGQKVRVRALAAAFSADVQSQMKLVTAANGENTAKIDVAEMERLQFQHGVVEPRFTYLEAKTVQQKYGPAFRKVIEQIDELSGIDKEAIENTEARFPAGGGSENGTEVSTAAAGGG